MRKIGYGTVLVTLMIVAGCADAETADNRGYTKAPLERAGVFIRGEGTSAMDSLGTPILPRDTVITEEQVQAPAASAPRR